MHAYVGKCMWRPEENLYCFSDAVHLFSNMYMHVNTYVGVCAYVYMCE